MPRLNGRGRLAQLVERLPYKQEVTGSNPVLPISREPFHGFEPIASLLNRGCRFCPVGYQIVQRR